MRIITPLQKGHSCIFRLKAVSLRPKVAEKGIWSLRFNVERFIGQLPAGNFKH